MYIVVRCDLFRWGIYWDDGDGRHTLWGVYASEETARRFAAIMNAARRRSRARQGLSP